MNLGTIRTEVSSRGFDYLTTSRLNDFANEAYQDVCEQEEWPFLEATTSGSPPVTISDLRTIESVTDSTQSSKLLPLDNRFITDYDTDLTTAGDPIWYYITEGSVVNTYPVGASNTLAIQYWKVPSALSSDADEPVIPDRFQRLIVEGAVILCYMDSDEPDMAAAVQERLDGHMDRMRTSLLYQQHDRAEAFVVQTGYHQDG